MTKRDSLSPEDRSERSRLITARILNLAELGQAATIMLYMHFRSEVQTASLLAHWLVQGKTVCVPRVIRSESRLLPVRISDPDRDLLPGFCGIPEPTPSLPASSVLPPATIDAVIVPGSVFDPKGGRLGYGGGYYDRFFSRYAPRALRIALAFDLQVVERVPTEAHDQAVDFVVTEHNLYPCRRIRHAQDRGLSQ